MPANEPLAERSPFLRYVRPWVRSVPALLATLLFLAVALAGWMGTRAGSVAVRYAALHPVRDPVLWQQIGDGTAPDAAWERNRTLGSALAAETLYLPPPVVLRVMALGHLAAFADVLFTRAHAYFLSHFFADRRFEWLDVYVNAITALDPDNPKVYLWAAQVLKLGQSIDADVIRHANRLLEAGLERFPGDWRLHMDLGFNLNFEQHGLSDAEKAANRLRARDHFATAAGIPGAPIDPNFVASLFDHADLGRQGLTYALQKYYEANPEQRTQLLRRIGALSEALAQGIKDEDARRKKDWAFLPTSLFSLVDDGGKESARLRRAGGATAGLTGGNP